MAQVIPQQLLPEMEALRQEGHNAELKEVDGWAEVIIQDYAVPPGYNKRSTCLRLKIPLSYPNGKPDMFWTDEDLVLANGQVPQSADGIEEAHGRKWRRFSWHPQNWCPGVDNLHTYLEFVNARLAKGK